MTTTTVTLRITADARGVVTGVNQASRDVAAFGTQARNAGAQAAAGFSAARAGVASISTQLQRLQSLAGAWAAFSGVRAVVSDMLRTADAASAVNARLKIATGSAQAYAAAQAEVRDIAVDARASLESVATLYTRLSQSAESLGYSQQKVSDITRSVAMAVTLTGGSAEAAAAGVTQLSQAFASGVLSGDEFRSVMENSPGIVKAMTDSLGLTQGQLRELAEEQKLTADIVAEAITLQMDTLREQMAKTPETVSQAIGQINNAWMLYTDAVLNASGETTALTQALGVVADMLLMEEQAARQGADSTSGLATALELAVGAAVIAKNAFEAVVNVLFAVIDTIRHFVGAWTGAFAETIKGIRAYQNALLDMDFDSAFDALVQGQQNAEAAIGASWNGMQAAWSSAGDGVSDAVADVSAMFEAFGASGKKAADTTTEAGKASDDLSARLQALRARVGELTGGMDESDKAHARAAKSARDYLQSLQEEVATFGLSEAALDQYTLAHTEGLTPAMRDAAASALAQIEANRKLKAAWDQAASAASSLKTGNAQLLSLIHI